MYGSEVVLGFKDNFDHKSASNKSLTKKKNDFIIYKIYIALSSSRINFNALLLPWYCFVFLQHHET